MRPNFLAYDNATASGTQLRVAMDRARLTDVMLTVHVTFHCDYLAASLEDQTEAQQISSLYIVCCNIRRTGTMVTTRSKTAQTHLEDYATKTSTLKDKSRQSEANQKSPPKANTSKKRKSAETTSAEYNHPGKRIKNSKTLKPAKTEHNEETHRIIINRAPVLQLWSACVAHFMYPELEWSTCLSAGSAVSTICAVAKGRSIGTVPAKDESESQEKKRQDGKKKAKDLHRMEFMHFKLPLKNNLALVSASDAKGKPGAEEPLRKKFGDDEYERVKSVFDEALGSWRGSEDELSGKAFGFYEKFRPDVTSGQKGWGRKGELSLEKVKDVVGR